MLKSKVKMRHSSDRTKDPAVFWRQLDKPIGVAGYEVTLIETLSKELKESLPTIEDIEAEFGKR
jgi:hypothetical protein